MLSSATEPVVTVRVCCAYGVIAWFNRVTHWAVSVLSLTVHKFSVGCLTGCDLVGWTLTRGFCGDGIPAQLSDSCIPLGDLIGQPVQDVVHL